MKVKAARTKKTGSYKADSASTGIKITMPLRDIPQSVSVVKKELIDSQNAFNLRDALKKVSGLTIAACEGGQTGDSISRTFHKSVQAEYWPGNRFVTVKRDTGNLFSLLTNLHKGAGMGIG